MRRGFGGDEPSAAADVVPVETRISDLEDDQADLVNGDEADQTTDGEEVAKKPKKKK